MRPAACAEVKLPPSPVCFIIRARWVCDYFFGAGFHQISKILSTTTVEPVETLRKRFLAAFRSAGSRLDPCSILQWAWIGQNLADLADLDFRQNRPAGTLVGIGDPCSRGAREFRRLYTLK